jgi:hypothetical protein
MRRIPLVMRIQQVEGKPPGSESSFPAVAVEWGYA